MRKETRLINGIPIKVGSKVKIKDNAPNSWFVPDMRQFLGTVQTVERFSCVMPEAVQIRQFNWNIRDLEPVIDVGPDPKKKEPVLFNEEELLRGVE